MNRKEKISGTAKLGVQQRKVLNLLSNGWVIVEQYLYSTSTIKLHMTNEEDIIEISGRMVGSLLKRNLLGYKLIYRTVQPDTDTWHYFIVPEIQQQVSNPTDK